MRGEGVLILAPTGVTGEVLEHAHQPRMVPAVTAEGGGRPLKQLLGRRRVWAAKRLRAARSLQGEVSDPSGAIRCGKPGSESALDHAFAMDLEDARGSKTRPISASLTLAGSAPARDANSSASPTAFDRQCDDDLVGDFGCLAVAVCRRTRVMFLAHQFETTGFDPGEGALRSPRP